jgi:hypothetical protein
MKLPRFRLAFPNLSWLRSKGKFVADRLEQRGKRNQWKNAIAGMAVLLLITIGPVAYFVFHNPDSAQAAWFDTNWGFRQKIPLSNSSGSTQTDFQVQITIDTATLITAGKLQTSCQDVRFTSLAGKVLPHWIEPNTCNSTTTKVWVKVDSIPSASSGVTADIYFYYGNASASSTSATTPTFIKDISGAAVAWPLDDTTTTQSYSRVVNATVSAGRNVVLNSTPTSATSWTLNANWAYASNAFTHTAGSTATVTQVLTGGVTTGKVYSVTYTVSGVSAGTVTVSLASSGTARSTNGTFTESIIAGGTTLTFTPTSAFNGSISNISVTQVNIPPSSGTATNLATDGDMEAAGTTAWPFYTSSTVSKQTGTPHGGTQALRVAYNGNSSGSAYNSPTSMVAGNVYRVYGYFRGDGSSTAPTIGNPGGTTITGTSSTAWQPFDFLIKSSGTILRLGLSVDAGYAEFDDIVITTDTHTRTGELLPDGNMEASGTASWVPVNSATLSKQTGTPLGGAQVLRVERNGVNTPLTHQVVFNVGKTYRVTGSGRSDGNSGNTLLVYNASTVLFSGTASTSWQPFDVTFIATSTTFRVGSATGTGTQYSEWDDISITEVDPLVGLPTNGVTLGSSTGTGGHLTNAYTFDGTNDVVNIYSSDLNSVFNATEGSVVAWAKVASSGTWTDGTSRAIVNISVDGANNDIKIYKSSSNNAIAFSYVGNSVGNANNATFSSTGWFMVAMTWSASSNRVVGYINGAQSAGFTGIGTWVGNLNSTRGVIGGTSSSGVTPWSGMINDVRIYPRVLTSSEIAAMYSSASDIQAYTTANYPGHELYRKFNSSVAAGAAASEETGAAPILYWKLDEGTGTTVKDSSSKLNTGTLGGTTLPTWQTEDQCLNGKCLFFGGQTSKVTGSTIARNIKTIAFWVRPNVLASQGLLNLDGGSHVISINSSGIITATGFTSPTYYINGAATTTPMLEQNKWSYVEITTGTGFNSTSSFTVGTDGTNFFTGYLDNLKFFNYARTATQVKTEYLFGSTGGGSSTVLGAAQPQLGGLVANWSLQDTTTTQSYSSVLNPTIGLGRNIATNGDFSTLSPWQAGTGWTVANGVAHNDGTGSSANLFQSPAVGGKAYEVTFTISNYVSGSLQPFAGTSNGTSRSANGTYTETLISSNSNIGVRTNTTFVGDVDNFIIRQINIVPSSGTSTTLLTDGDMETAGVAAWTVGNSATLSKQTGTPHGGTNVLRVARSTVNSPYTKQSTLTSGVIYRVYGYVRSDGSATPRIGQNDMATQLFVGTTGTNWQPFDFNFIANSNNIGFGSTTGTGTQYVEFDDVVVVPDTNLRVGELMQDRDMEASGTNDWQAAQTATLSKQTTSPHGGAQVLRVAWGGNSGPGAQQNTLDLGKTYRVTGFTRSDGTFIPQVADTGTAKWTGTTSTSWQPVDVTFVATGNILRLRGNNNVAGYTEWDDMSVTEVAPLVGVPTNGVVLGTAAGGHLNTGYTFDGTNDNVNIYSGDLNSAFNATEGSLVAWAKVSSAGVWTDLGTRNIVRLAVDANNYIQIQRDGTNNEIQFNYAAGGTNSNIFNNTMNTTGWFQVAITWSKSKDQAIAYTNGAKVGTMRTGLGTWNGNLSSTLAAIGASGSAGGGPWSGMINDVQLYNRALSPAEITQLYNYAPGPIAYYNFEDGSGATVLDRTSNGNNATWNGTAPYWTTGKYGKGGNFDGTSSYLTITDTALLNMDGKNFTTSFWMKPTAGGSTRGLVDWGYQCGNNDREVGITMTSGNGISTTASLDGTSSSIVNVSAGTANLNQWNHIEVVYDASLVSLYVNGMLVGSAARSSTAIHNSAQAIRIGNDRCGNEYFKGTIDDVLIYDYARTPAQVIEDMRGTGSTGIISSVAGNSSTKPASAMSYWKLDESQGTTANDISANANSLTLSSAAWLIPGKVNSGWNGNGTNWLSRADDDDFDFAATDDFSIGMWFKSDSATNPSSSECIICKTNLATVAGYAIIVNTNGTIAFQIDDDSAFQPDDVVTTTGDFYDGTWHYVLARKTGTSRIDLYIDGKLRASKTTLVATGSLANSNTLYIGDREGANNGDEFNGDLDEIKFYRIALNQDQINSDYNQNASINYGTGAPLESSTLTDGTGAAPVAEWKFDEKTGTTVNDSSGNGNTGTLTNGPVWTTGKSGPGLKFDGTDDYVTVPSSSSLQITGDITTEMWIYPTSLPTTSLNRMVLLDKGYNKEFRVGFISEGANNPLQVFAGGSGESGNAIQSIAANQWQHIVIVRDNTAKRVYGYKNGVLDSQFTYTVNPVSSSNAVTIGKRTDGSEYFAGKIDDVRIFNYARTPAQIAYDYNRGAPLVHWKFDECQGTTIGNSSGLGNTGTITIGSSGTQTQAGTCNTSGTAWANGITGKLNNSLNFDGTDDYVDLGNTTVLTDLPTRDMSVSAWIYDGQTANNWSTIISKFNSTFGRGWSLRTFSDGSNNRYLRFNAYSSTPAVFESSAGTIPQNTWTHVVAVWNATTKTATLYINAKQPTYQTQTTGVGTYTTDAADSARIGCQHSSCLQFMKGQIDDVRIYNYALSATQVKNVYNGGAAVNYGPSTGAP